MSGDFLKIIEENNKLKKENKYLKRLLEEHNIRYTEIKEIKNIDYSKEEKINIYNSYFRGRKDVFAVKYLKPDKSKGYVPVCKNSFTVNCDKSKYPSCKGCPYKVYSGMTTMNLLEHFTGKKSYGIYSMLDDDSCYFLVVDFDEGDFFDSAIRYKNCCENYGMDCAIEISQSGFGAHVWLFFEEAVKAKHARKIGDFILNKAFFNAKAITLKSFDRFYPSQDYLSKEKIGNLIALPLDGKCVAENKTVFVDDNKLPYENQIAFLNSVKKIKTLEVDLLLEKIKQENELGVLPKNVVKKLQLSKTDFTDKLIIYYEKDLIIEKKSVSIKALKFLMRLGSVANNEFYDKQRMRQSTYNIPRVLQLFKEDERFVSIPRGCLKELKLILDNLDIDYEIVDKRSNGMDIDVEFNGELKAEQETALVNIKCEDNGVFVAPTAFGKTVLSAALISEIGKNTLVLVNNVTLLNQWLEKLNEFLKINYSYKKEKDKFGVYYGAKKKLTYQIDVASIHSFDDGLESEEILCKYGLIIIDEVHHLAAKTFERVLRNTNAKYIYGLTATPKRFDKNEKIIYKTIGDIIYEHKISANSLKKFLVPRITRFRLLNKDKILSYAEQCNKLAVDAERNALILDDAKNCLKENKNIILLSDRIEHLNLLYQELKELCTNTFIINGQMKTIEKKKFNAQINSITEDGYVILATGKYVGEGFDLPSLNTLFITMPFKWEGMLAQYVGRLHRANKDKKEVTVYDYVDLKIPMFSKMFDKRLKAYKKHDYILNSDSIRQEDILYSKYSYKKQLFEDIKCAKKEIILLIDSYEVKTLSEILLQTQDLCVRIFSLNEFTELNFSGYTIIKEQISSPINAIVIDNRLFWYGELNPFKEAIYDEDILRIDDELYAKEIIDEIIRSS